MTPRSTGWYKQAILLLARQSASYVRYCDDVPVVTTSPDRNGQSAPVLPSADDKAGGQSGSDIHRQAVNR
jgi:hypothetical protein